MRWTLATVNAGPAIHRSRGHGRHEGDDQPDAPSEPGGSEVRPGVCRARPEEQQAHRRLAHAEPLAGEEGEQRRGEKATAEAVEGKERRDPDQDPHHARRERSQERRGVEQPPITHRA